MKTYWWISFATETDFVGVVIMEATDPNENARSVHLRVTAKRLNPAPRIKCSVSLHRFDAPAPPPKGTMYRLIRERAELHLIEAEWHSAMEASGAPRVRQ